MIVSIDREARERLRKTDLKKVKAAKLFAARRRCDHPHLHGEGLSLWQMP
jgi:hypothetical protein